MPVSARKFGNTIQTEDLGNVCDMDIIPLGLEQKIFLLPDGRKNLQLCLKVRTFFGNIKLFS